jgi:hypothetical protein
MGVPIPITALRAVRALVLDQNDTTLLPVAWAIDAWLSGGGDFAEALGLAPGWHSALRQRQRDEALRELATRHFPGLCGRPGARAMVAAATDYETRRWPRDRAAGRRPDGADGLLFDVLTLGRIPAEEMLRKCIGEEIQKTTTTPG